MSLSLWQITEGWLNSPGKKTDGSGAEPQLRELHLLTCRLAC